MSQGQRIPDGEGEAASQANGIERTAEKKERRSE